MASTPLQFTATGKKMPSTKKVQLKTRFSAVLNDFLRNAVRFAVMFLRCGCGVKKNLNRAVP